MLYFFYKLNAFNLRIFGFTLGEKRLKGSKTCMKYVRSHSFDKDRLFEVLNIDDVVYEKNLTGSYQSVSKRYKRNKEMFVFALDEEDKLCGYVCFFPISLKLLTELETATIMFDDNISAEDVEKYSKEKVNNIFVISVALYPKFRRKGFGAALIREMFAFLNDLAVDGHTIGSVYATTISEEGEKLFAKYNFKNIRIYDNGAKLVKCDYSKETIY